MTAVDSAHHSPVDPDELSGTWWLNTATVNGGVAIAVGLLILAFPNAGELVVRLGVGAVLITLGISRLTLSMSGRGERGFVAHVALSLAAVAMGLGLVVAPIDSLRTIALLIGAYLIVRALVFGVPAIFGHTDDRLGRLIRGGLALAAGILLLIAPEAVLSGVMVLGAAVLIGGGALLLTYGLHQGRRGLPIEPDALTAWAVFTRWLNLRDVGDAGRDGLAERLFFENPGGINKTVTWWVMLLLSVAIATFGVLQDSTAVVIGAMLIAPLMVPILGVAAAVVNGWGNRAVRSLLWVGLGVVAAVALAWIIGSWLPAVVPYESNSQITSRVNPNIIDMLIALAAGAAGAYANVDRRASDSVAGVAIAVALVPPLSVVGLTLEQGLFDQAVGAMLLFATNLVAILLSAAVVFLLMGVAPVHRMRRHRESITRVLSVVVTAALAITIPLSLTVEDSLVTVGKEKLAQEAVNDWVAEAEDVKLDEVTLDTKDEGNNVVTVSVSGSGRLPPLSPLESALSDAYGTPVTVAVWYSPALVFRYSDADGFTSQLPDAGTVAPEDAPRDQLTTESGSVASFRQGTSGSG